MQGERSAERETIGGVRADSANRPPTCTVLDTQCAGVIEMQPSFATTGVGFVDSVIRHTR
jgi:hypothetical protein